MTFYVDTAKGKRINQAIRDSLFIIPNDLDLKTIKKGEKCLVFSNNTIGQGRRTFNYKKQDAIKMLNKLIKELKNGK